jgi:hypothetical protein
MKLAVSYDDAGNITTLFDPEGLRNERGTLRYVPQPGEHHHLIEVPAAHRDLPFGELPNVLRVEADGGHPRFVAKA